MKISCAATEERPSIHPSSTAEGETSVFLTLDDRKKTLRSYLQDEAWWEKRNVSYISKANKNGSVPGDMLVWDKLPLTLMDFSGHIQLEMDYSIFRREPLPFPLPASPRRHPLWVRLVRKTQQSQGVSLMELSLHYCSINQTHPSKSSAGV